MKRKTSSLRQAHSSAIRLYTFSIESITFVHTTVLTCRDIDGASVHTISVNYRYAA